MRRLVGTVAAWVRASHPLPVLAVTAVAAGLAVSYGRHAAGTVTVVAAVLAGQLSVGWLNDLVDARRDAETGRAGKPVAAGRLSRPAVAAGVLAAAVAAVALSLPSGLPATAVHLAALVSAWAYDLGAKKSALSVLPYALSFGLLPAFVSLGLPGAPLPPVWLMAAAALLGCAAHFVNVLPDLADDLAVGVRGLPHRLGAGRSRAVAAALVLVTSVLLVLGPSGAVSGARLAAVPAVVLIIGAGWLLGRRPGSRAAFHAVLTVAVVDVVLLLSTGVPTAA
ncbi:UbiA family prenyltransferase [Streptomyces sp. TRM 70351]|uniref:UbiA family prenyltransferase n=1 Tax=Streptomyces sp. TRM 70351 TaxID=3116552 RepID=UPI002E7B45C4|nr:UbiA family prenyltransferase [Streptomyces sp. TRM 70351]MEE1930569.1 UbiA family prenyltransferase [Streptomyces sp. TRM 70351]